LDAYAIVGKKPKHYGFGMATAMMPLTYSRVDPYNSGIKAKDYKTFVYKWKIG